MKSRVLSAAVMIPLLIVVMFFLPSIWLTIVLSLAVCIGAFELLRAVGYSENKRVLVYAQLAAIALPFGFYFKAEHQVFRAVLYLLMFLMFLEAVIAYGRKEKPRFEEILAAIFAGAVIPYFLSHLVSLKQMNESGIYVILPFVITVMSDTGAFFVGKYLGKHRGILPVSPNKTLEGFIGSMVCGILSVIIYGVILRFAVDIKVNFALLVIYGILGNLATQLGDLSFSLIKRQHGIKDYSRLIPGHGGILDRFDSAIFTAPVVYMLLELIPAF